MTTNCAALSAARMTFPELSHDYPGRPEAVGQARSWVADCVADCPAADDVVLCVSEATSNAVKFTRSGTDGTFTVRIAAHPGRVRVEVADQGGPGTPALRAPANGAEGGRGLALIAALAAAWGVNGGGAGRCVWMEFTWPDADLAHKASGTPARRPLCEAAAAPALPPSPQGTPGPVPSRTGESRMTNHSTTTTPSRALRAVCAAARSVGCGHCAATAGQPCLTRAGQDGYHLARFGRARARGLITADAMATAIMAAGPVFTPASVITGGAS